MFEHEGLLKEFEWVTKESEKKHIGESIAKTSLEMQEIAFALIQGDTDSVDKLTKQNLDNAKQEYLDAVKLAKTKPRPKATITKDPSFATQDPKDLLPRRYNPETGGMDIV